MKHPYRLYVQLVCHLFAVLYMATLLYPAYRKPPISFHYLEKWSLARHKNSFAADNYSYDAIIIYSR